MVRVWLGCAGCFTWLSVSYLRNLPLQFLAGLGMLVVLLALHQWHSGFILDWRLPQTPDPPLPGCPSRLPDAPAKIPVTDPAQRLYSYSVAGRDPVAFARWWDAYRDQWDSMGHQVLMSDPRDGVRALDAPTAREAVPQPCPY
jgi:hypothetical protein